MILFIYLFNYLLASSNCVTHWKVTETGRIEAKDDSLYTLQRPYDLAAFLKQDDRVQRLNYIKRLLASKDVITKRDSKSERIFFNYNFSFCLNYSRLSAGFSR